MSEKPVLAVIGGSGLYQMPSLKNQTSIEVETPFGKPSAPITIGQIHGKTVAFLARHGIGHHITPTEINFRANIYALRSLGAERVVSISACGSLREDYAPGHIVIPDNLFDMTKRRVLSFFGEGCVAHIGSADPYCPTLSTEVFDAVQKTGATVHKGGTFITIEGPRFSTKAESHLFRSWGMSIIGMTAIPEAFLAREAEMCYATMAHVTDYDVWHVSEAPVSVEMVLKTLHQNTDYAQQAIENLVLSLDENHTCTGLLENTIMTSPDKIPAETRRKLGLFIDKYLPPLQD